MTESPNASTVARPVGMSLLKYGDPMARDKAGLDIFWLKDGGLDNPDDLPPPDVLQQEIHRTP